MSIIFYVIRAFDVPESCTGSSDTSRFSVDRVMVLSLVAVSVVVLLYVLTDTCVKTYVAPI